MTFGNKKFDLLAKKDGKNSVIEIKATSEGVLKSIPQLIELKILPEIDSIYIAAPRDVLTEDIGKIASDSQIGIGLIRVADNKAEIWVSPQEVAQARLTMRSLSLDPNIIQGESFNFKVELGNQGGKIARNITVECIPLGPFNPVDGLTRKIKDFLPTDQKFVEFKLKVEDEAIIGRYFIFLKWTDQIVKESTMITIQVQSKNPEYVEGIIADTIASLNYALSTNLENSLRLIDEAIQNGVLEIENHIIDKSIWNTLGMAYLNQGLLKQAELIYRSMLGILQKYEATYDMRIHKGLAFHNLGIVLYHQGKMKESKKMLYKAYEEDKITYGVEDASKGQAKKALEELQFGKVN